MLMNGLMLCVMLNFGICTMECDFNSVGPECNFKNIAYRKLSRHDSNSIRPHYTSLANDNSLSTCSYTSENNKHKPWWNLWLSEYTTIKKLEFLTKDSHRRNFPYFTVKVYNTSYENFHRKGNLEGGTDCYQQPNSVPPDTKIQVTCVGSPVGNLIRLQLYSEHYQLVLCDFRLYEDCKNGFYGNGCERCSDNCNPPQQGGDRYCRLSDGVCLNGCKPGWKGSRCENKCEKGTWGPNCKMTCGKCDNSPCDRFTGVCPRGCAAGFKGQRCTQECDDGYYGKHCKQRCEYGCSRSGRNAICDKENGRCLNGCNPGHKGLFCNEVCEKGVEWGPNCANTCGKCDNSQCDRFNGICPGGCAAGFKLQTCTEECGNGYYGNNCTSKCEDGCSRIGRNDICDKGNGRCLNGCNPGYKGLLCNEECDDRSYGIRCEGRCSENCKDVCDKKTGMCSNCKNGWKGNNCSEECEDWKWGFNCQNDCGKCLTSPCNKVNGTCSEGCAAGYQQTEECHTGLVSGNKEVPCWKPTSIILGIISVVLLVYAIVITVFCKRKTTQNASPGKQGNGSTPEVDVAVSSDKGDETDHYNTINPQRTESVVYESIQTEAELSV